MERKWAWRHPRSKRAVDSSAPQAINEWLLGPTALGYTIAKNLVARWDGVGVNVGSCGPGCYSTWQLGQVMFVMRVYGYDTSTSPIALNNGLVTTYSAVFSSMESELWSLQFPASGISGQVFGFLPNGYTSSGPITGSHDPENQDSHHY